MFATSGWSTTCGDRAQLVDEARRVGKDDVGAGFGVGLHPGERVLEPRDRDGVGAGDDDGAVVCPGRKRRAHLLDHLVARDDLLALHVPAALGKRLILDLHRRCACALELPDGAGHVHQLAVAGVGVRDDGTATGSR